MRKFILAVAAAATFGAMSVTAEAMPISGAVAPAVQPNPAIEKTVVVVRRTVVRRPGYFARRPAVRRSCRTVITAGRRVTRCVTR